MDNGDLRDLNNVGTKIIKNLMDDVKKYDLSKDNSVLFLWYVSAYEIMCSLMTRYEEETNNSSFNLPYGVDPLEIYIKSLLDGKDEEKRQSTLFENFNWNGKGR